MKRFEDKVVLITGGRSGIGLAVAKKFRDDGAKVLTVQRNVAEEFESITADLAEPMNAEAVIEEVISRHGRLDILINNAGVMPESLVEDTSLDEWMRTVNINLSTPFMLIKAALFYLKISQGSIVNISSIEGLGVNPRHAAYATTKAGLHGLTRAIAIDHGQDGIRCNAVAPGWIDTQLNNDFIKTLPDPENFQNSIRRLHPIRRIGTAAEVANLVAWLASDEASFVTGQVWTIDGGRMAQLSLP